jgi:hypothetical protein
MSMRPSSFLHAVLTADAVASAAAGLMLAVASTRFAGMLGAPAPLLQAAGLVLIVYAGLVGWLGTRRSPPRAGVRVAIAVNAVWAADCVLLLLGGWIEPTGLGTAFVLVQAAVVVLFAELQYVGQRRTAPAAA